MPHNVCQRCPRSSVCFPFIQANAGSFEFASRVLMRGEHLYHQGQQSRCLYILRSGALKSYTTKKNGDEFVMGFYFPADLFGWEATDAGQRTISIVALTDSNVCVIPTEKLFFLTQDNLLFGEQLLNMINRRIQQDNIALLRTTASQRVATFFLQLSFRYQLLGFSKEHLQLPMTHQDIANYLRITAGTISRILHQWEKRKWIAIENHVIKLLDIPCLQMVADG
jgi:CRP/FNR family transcriptional regulator